MAPGVRMGCHGERAAYAGLVRVVAGEAGGRRLQAPRGATVRPTSERVREAVFATLGSLDAVDGARVLDLFAGTGALGIEALSRGAASATFVDRDPAAVATIRANLIATGLSGRATVTHRDVQRFLEETQATFDLVLADPPYDFDGWPALLERIPAPLAVLEARTSIDPGPGWDVVRARRYGDTAVTVVRRAAE